MMDGLFGRIFSSYFEGYVLFFCRDLIEKTMDRIDRGLVACTVSFSCRADTIFKKRVLVRFCVMYHYSPNEA